MSEQITGDGFVQNTHEEIAALAAMIMRSERFSGISEEHAHFLASVCFERRCSPLDHFSVWTCGGGEEVVYSVKKSKGVPNE